jgi:hypothetical protein
MDRRLLAEDDDTWAGWVRTQPGAGGWHHHGERDSYIYVIKGVVTIEYGPGGANLDTGNINLQLTLMLWAAQFTGPRLGGLLWALATWMKWIPAVHWFILDGRARVWGLVWLAVSIGLSLITLPLTIIQLQTLFGFGARPIRLDFLVYLWAFIPWLYRARDPLAVIRPAWWRRAAVDLRAWVARPSL